MAREEVHMHIQNLNQTYNKKEKKLQNQTFTRTLSASCQAFEPYITYKTFFHYIIYFSLYFSFSYCIIEKEL